MGGFIAAAFQWITSAIAAVDSTLSLGGRLAGLFRSQKPTIRARLGVTGAGTPKGWLRLRVVMKSTDERGWRVTSMEFVQPAGLLLAHVPRQSQRPTPQIEGTSTLVSGGPAVEPAGTKGRFGDEHSADFLVLRPVGYVAGPLRLVVAYIDRARPERTFRQVIGVEPPVNGTW